MRAARESTFRVVGLCLLAFGRPIAAADKPTPTTIPQFLSSLPEAGRLGFIVAALDARDRALSNCRFTVRESGVTVKRATEQRKVRLLNEFQYRRHDGIEWVHAVEYAPTPPRGISRISDIRWDGTVSTGIGYPPYVGKHHEGRIDPTMNDYFTFVRYFEIFGTHVHLRGSAAPPVAALLRQMDNERRPIHISTELLDGVTLVKVVFPGDFSQITLWLDPAKGFLMIGCDRFWESGKVSTKVTHRVAESRLVGGVWVPVKTKRIDDIAIYDEVSEIVYEADNFQFGNVAVVDVSVAFPPGCEVVDAVQKIAYTVRPDGRYELTRLADSEAHKIYNPPSNNIVASVDGAAKRYGTEPLIFASAAAPAAPTRWSLGQKAAVVVSIIVAALIGVVVVRRRIARA